jgi:hypothetical protein
MPTGRAITPELHIPESAAVAETNGLAEQQASHHPAQQRQMPLVGSRAVLTEKARQLSMEPGVGIHGGLVWCENPKPSRLPAHPMI